MKKYKILLDTSGLKYEGEGDTIEEALNNLEVSWMEIKSKGIMTITYGEKKAEHMFFLLQLRRLFRNKFMRKLWITRFNFLLQ